eukprot:TRINITY_DN9963_c0_g1_i1.p1 TRINITY_DN9963_c0_g1~~TRINITY_DN9963_c0_g1_i1.p1  ORF type:complete len:373 (+),score=120.91 TRINITY_DN9963_c0_g1_i1:90-1121(+)
MAGCQVRLEEGVKEALAGRIEPAPGQKHVEHLRCTVCKDPAFDSAVRTMPCGHLFHKDCLERSLADKVGEARNCPDCRKELPAGEGAYMVDRVSKSILDEVEVGCPQGCGEPPAKRVRFDALADHVQQHCPETALACSSRGCGKVLPRKDMEKHLSKCEHAMVFCEQCNQSIERGTLRNHKANFCTHRHFTCAYCKKKNLVYHSKQNHELKCSGQVPFSVVAALEARLRRLERKCLAIDLGVPEEIVVDSKEKPDCNGTYGLLPERHNKAPVWGMADCRVYRSEFRNWMIATASCYMNTSRGILKCTSKDKSLPLHSEGWLAATGSADKPWVPAPQSAVTAAA